MGGRMSARVWGWIGVALVAGLVAAAALFLRDMSRAYERIHERGTVISSPYGDIQYTEGGSGQPVLVIHGSGGGEFVSAMARLYGVVMANNIDVRRAGTSI